MRRLERHVLIEDELKKWENRVFYPELKFKENTIADLDALEKLISVYTMRDKMFIVSSETEACVYKIGRFFIETGMKNDKITFLDGDVFLPYLDVEGLKWKNRQLIDELINSIKDEITRKTVIIPELNVEWGKELALYFMAKLKDAKPYGILFFSSKNVHGNLAETLIEQTYIDVFEFPKSIYIPKKEKILPDDNY